MKDIVDQQIKTGFDVVNDGEFSKTGGFSAPGGIVTKLQLLTIEGAEPSGPTLFEHLPLQVAARRRG